MSGCKINRDHMQITGFPGGSVVENPPASAGDGVHSLGWEDALEEKMAIQYPCLRNTMDRGAWWATGHGVEESGT